MNMNNNDEELGPAIDKILADLETQLLEEQCIHEEMEKARVALKKLLGIESKDMTPLLPDYHNRWLVNRDAPFCDSPELIKEREMTDSHNYPKGRPEERVLIWARRFSDPNEPKPIVRDRVTYYQVGRNSTHSFYVGIHHDTEKLYRASDDTQFGGEWHVSEKESLEAFANDYMGHY